MAGIFEQIAQDTPQNGIVVNDQDVRHQTITRPTNGTEWRPPSRTLPMLSKTTGDRKAITGGAPWRQLREII
jgi:hypothetical protein